MTMSTLAVLRTLLDQAPDPVYGLEVTRATGLKSGTLYPILDRLERAGWLSAEWESVDPRVAGRPRRRHYRLTGEGAASARIQLAEAHRCLAPAPLRPALGGA